MSALDAVVVTHESSHVVGRAVASLLRSDASLDGLIIVDNASSDLESMANEISRIAHPTLRVKVIELPVNGGFGAAANVGLRHCRADRALLLNPDVVFPPHWFDALAQGKNRMGAALASPNLDPSRKREPASKEALVSDLPAACLLLDVKAVSLVGGFDENIFMYWEDFDLCWRLLDHGLTLCRVDASHVTHDKGSGSRRDVSRAERLRSGAYVLSKHWRLELAPLLTLLAAGSMIRALRTLGPISSWHIWRASWQRGRRARRSSATNTTPPNLALRYRHTLRRLIFCR